MHLSYDEEEVLFQEEEDGGHAINLLGTERWKVLIVDDEEEIHQVTKMVLGDVTFEGKGLDFIHAYSAQEAKLILEKEPEIAVVFLDVVMERENSGLELVEYIRHNIKNSTVRIILRTGQPGQAPESNVIVQYDINDYKEKTELTSQKLFTTLVVALRSFRDLNKINDLNLEIENTQREIIYTLGEVVEIRSMETAYHVKRVAEYSALLAEKFGLLSEEIELIRLASPMHDIGKIGISDNILNKPGALTDDEYGIMKSHTTLGYDMLKYSNRKILHSAAIIALHHHEKYNGTGYPLGLKGEEIHLFGRITAIADVYDALSSNRVYKSSWSEDDIIDFFKKERGEHFDPLLTDLFLRYFEDFNLIRLKYQEEVVGV